MHDERDFRLELSSLPAPDEPAKASARRAWLSVRFVCCNVYQRVYRSGDAYAGRCPRCLKPVRFRVGSGGTSCRAFEVG